MAEKFKKKRCWGLRSWRLCKQSTAFLLRVVLLILMFLLLLFVGAWIFLVKTFNAQRISEVIAEELQKRLDRPVAVSSIDLTFLNTVELKGFQVLDTVGAPGSALVSADKVTLRFRLLPLLEHQLIIDEVVFKSPRFSIIRLADGSNNIPRLKHVGNTVSTGRTSGEKLTVSVEDWTVKNGVLSYQDQTSGTTHAVYGFNLQLEQLRFDELSRFSLDMVLRNQWKNGIADMEIEGTGHVNFADFNWEEFEIRDLRTKVFLFQSPVQLTIDLDNLKTPHFNIRAQVPAFTDKQLSVFHLEKTPFSAPPSSVVATGVLDQNYQVLKINQLAVSADDVKLEGKGQLNFESAPYTADFKFSTNVFNLAGKEKYYAVLGKYKLKGKGSAEGAISRQKGNYQLDLLTLRAQEMKGSFYGFEVESVTGEFQAKKNFTDLYASTSNGKVTVQHTVFDKLSSSASWRNGNLYAYIAGAELNGVPVKLNTSVQNLKSSRRKIRSNLHFSNFDPMKFIATVQDFVDVIEPLTPSHAPKPVVEGDLAWLRNFRDRLPNFMSNFSGTITADSFSSQVLSAQNFRGEFELSGLKAGMKQLSGSIKAQLENGVIHQMEKLAEEQQALNVTFQPFIIMHRMERAGSFKVGKVLKDVSFTEMSAGTAFENGRMQITNAYTVGPSISAAVSGWVDWVNENFDMIIWTMFSNTSRSGALAENLTDESGNPALAFRVSSSMLKPKVDMQRAKKTGATIRAAQAMGLQTDFKTGKDFVQGDFHAKK